MSKKDNPNPESKTEKHKRLLEKITDQVEAVDFYDALKETIKCYTIHNTKEANYKYVYSSLLELQDFFYLQILLGKKRRNKL